MISIKCWLKNSSVWRKIRPLFWEKRILSAERKRFYSQARQEFLLNPGKGDLADYTKALKRHRVSYGEYMYKFEYWKLTEAQRDEFISCSEMQCIYRKTVQPEVKSVFWNKVLFLNKFSDYVQRRWIEVRKSNYETFRSMLLQSDCIAKPIEGWRGQGIAKINRIEEGMDVKDLFNECVNNNILLEERIHACKEIEEYHPQSLNTVRVVTISNPDRFVIFGAILRMGTGDSIIDNTHNGGIFASIDVKTGVIETDGLDSNGRTYIAHPDSGKRIRGFKIPYWNNVVETCGRATKVLPELIFAGWDVVVMEDGRIALIEGNHGPDFDGGMQAPKKIGVKNRLRETVMDLQGFNPLDYIPVSSGTLNGYRYNEKVTE